MAMEAEARTAGLLWSELRSLAHGLAEHEWDKATPCARWTVKDLLAHVTGLQTAMDGTAEQPPAPEGWSPQAEGLSGLDAWTELGVVARRNWSRERLLEELEVAAAGHVARFAAGDPGDDAIGPFGPTTLERLHGFRMFDLWVHLQDFHLALGRPLDLGAQAPGGADACRHVFRGLPALAVKRAGLGDGDRLRVRVEEPAAIDAALVVEGGRAAWDPGAEAADAVEAKPGVLALLLAGRGTPEEWRAEGGLDWRGTLGEAFVQRARVFGA
ncbi:MAG TPA: maleylpyruvate isomerase family mycothiol-dependent enzyme [Egibacteraceae bacterium]|nr:maleylpyruvate isomerase family mycothiol-dependent enzyme [Egibacteraceae bacterium]